MSSYPPGVSAVPGDVCELCGYTANCGCDNAIMVLCDMYSIEPTDNLADLLEAIKRSVYKYTSCGAWIEIKDRRLKLGSIVEGCDFGTLTYALPCKQVTKLRIQERLAAIEKEAEATWKWANEQDCEGDPPDFTDEFAHLNPYFVG